MRLSTTDNSKTKHILMKFSISVASLRTTPYYIFSIPLKNITKLNSVALASERTIPTERPPLGGEVVPTFADRGCGVVSATDSHGR
jgi:hypothetical protein